MVNNSEKIAIYVMILPTVTTVLSGLLAKHYGETNPNVYIAVTSIGALAGSLLTAAIILGMK